MDTVYQLSSWKGLKKNYGNYYPLCIFQQFLCPNIYIIFNLIWIHRLFFLKKIIYTMKTNYMEICIYICMYMGWIIDWLFNLMMLCIRDAIIWRKRGWWWWWKCRRKKGYRATWIKVKASHERSASCLSP